MENTVIALDDQIDTRYINLDLSKMRKGAKLRLGGCFSTTVLVSVDPQNLTGVLVSTSPSAIIL